MLLQHVPVTSTRALVVDGPIELLAVHVKLIGPSPVTLSVGPKAWRVAMPSNHCQEYCTAR